MPLLKHSTVSRNDALHTNINPLDYLPTAATYLRHSWALQNDLKHNVASFLLDLLCLQVTQMPRSPGLTFFFLLVTHKWTEPPLYVRVNDGYTAQCLWRNLYSDF